ncbi:MULTISPECIES: hypothetical protein [Anoxybacillaceae]|uniref:Uncharacterized protein n=2 Tax=Anoxybacillaceae TaxID=3120669 RepID=A0A023DHW1_9BACL|nr:MULTISPECIES: hypothetical protein [Parageobacillus]MBB3853941.1 hypothetical protein [Parageobacillus caldoxylosilyticus]OXB94634.1 hypothetical protein B9L23_07105 [Parageobacillus galactosidasius]GAJ40865.1 hypothetical protein GCA01S_052_00410 [Parageobacillus caldoxylosilyticus NBRC 107762]
MKTVKLTEQELATLKTALTMQIKSIDNEIRQLQSKGYISSSLLEIKQQYEQAFEVLNFAQ